MVESYEPVIRPERKRVGAVVAWLCAALSSTILVAGIYLDQTWWMLSFPVAITGAICGGRARRFVAMIINILVASVLYLALAVFAP